MLFQRHNPDYFKTQPSRSEPRPLLFPQHWMYCITSTIHSCVWLVRVYADNIMRQLVLWDIHTNKDGSFQFGDHCIITRSTLQGVCNTHNSSTFPDVTSQPPLYMGVNIIRRKLQPLSYILYSCSCS